MANQINQVTKINQIKADWRYSDDESFNEMQKRAKEVEEHLIKHHGNQNVVCVSHIAIMMLIVLQAILKDKLTPEVYWQFYYHARHNNTGITHLEYSENTGWYLVTWNDTEHL